MRQSHRLIWNSLVIWVMRIFRLVPEIFLLPFIIHRLGEDLYGIYILGWSIVPVLDLLQSGMSSGVVKYSAQYFEQKQQHEINKVLSTSCILSGVVGLVGGLFTIVMVNFVPGWADGIAGENLGAFKFTCNSVSVMVMLSFPLMPYSGIIHSLQRYDAFTFVKTAFAYIRVVAVVCWYVFIGPSLEFLMVISAASYLLSNLCLVFVAYHMVPELRNQLSLCNRATMKMILGFGLMVFLCSMCLVINNTGVKWLMGVMVSPAFVAVMAIMLKPSELIKEIVMAMSLSMMPAASKYSAMNDHKMLRELFIRSTRYITIVVTLGMIAVILMTKPVLKLWMGPEYEHLSVYVILLCGGASLWMSSSGAYQMLRGMGMLKTSFVCEIVSQVFVVIGMILLLLLLGISEYWAVTIGLVSGQCIGVILRILFCAAKIQSRLIRLFWHAYGETFVVASLVMVFALMACKYLKVNSLAVSLVVSIISIMAFIACFGFKFATQQEKYLAKEVLSAAILRCRRIVAKNENEAEKP